MENYFQIELSQGQVALVSAEDFEDLSKYKWYATWSKFTRSFYAGRNSRKAEGDKRHAISMHRQIMAFPEGLQIDHINGNTLDNRRCNLRVATHMENGRNRKKNCNNSSGFKGVCWMKRDRKWRAKINTNGKFIYLGYHDTPESAYAAYCEAAEKHHGEFRRSA